MNILNNEDHKLQLDFCHFAKELKIENFSWSRSILGNVARNIMHCRRHCSLILVFSKWFFPRIYRRPFVKYCSTIVTHTDNVTEKLVPLEQNISTEKIMDARQKLGYLHNKKKQSFTGKEIEEKIIFNSVIDSLYCG